LQITTSTYLSRLTGNKFLKQTQDLWASHTCQTENNDKVFLGTFQGSYFQTGDLRKQLSKTYLQNLKCQTRFNV